LEQLELLGGSKQDENWHKIFVGFCCNQLEANRII